LKAIAELKGSQIDAWRNERLSDAFIYSTGLIRMNFLQLLKTPNNAAFKSAILEHLDEVRQIRGYQNMILASPNGRLLFSLDPTMTELETVTKELIARTVSAREPLFGDLFRCTVCKHVHLDVAAPIPDDVQRPVAVVILRTDPDKILYPLIQSWPLPSRSAETVLVRREGDNILFLNVLRHRSDPALTICYPLSRTDVPAIQAVMGKTGEFEGHDYRGADVLADLRPIPGTPWFMVAKVDTDEILAEARFRGGMILFMVVLGILVTGAMAVILFSNRQRNLYHRLYEAEREQRKDREEIRATLYGIGDGVIVTNAAGRVRRMNPVAENLTGWTETESLGRSLTEVFRIVQEETREEVENPAARVLREGLVVGLANHTLLIASDGSERPIADSGAPIRDDDGNVTGVVLVFRDQTVERAAQKALRDSEHRFRSTLDHMIEGCQLINHDWHYIYINDAADIHNRRPKEELLGNKYMDIWPGIEVTEVFQVIRRCLEERVITHMENEFVFLDGKKSWFELRIQPVPEGALILSADITERKIAEGHRELALQVLATLNRSNDISWLIKDLLQQIKNYTGMEAVGFRLRDGDDYPYYETNGFPPHSVEAERHLCARDEHGEIIRDPQGNPVLECMCGNVICGRADSSKPFFTPQGSFWSNCTTELLTSTTDEDRLTHTRNRCNAEGYESVALIPVRSGNEVIGLLQLNDRRKGMFTKESIQFYEGIGESIGIVLARRRATELLRESEAFIKAVMDNLPIGIAVNTISPDVNFVYINDNFFNFYRISRDMLNEPDSFWTSVYEDPEFREKMKKRVLDDCASGDPDRMNWEYVPITRSGGEQYFITARNIPIPNKQLMISAVWDVTERKRAEEMQDKLQKRLLQSQKMEAIGTLAGGIAHDFNNILAAIIGYSELAIPEAPEGSQVLSDLTKILQAGNRARDVVNQILTFSRQREEGKTPLDIAPIIKEAMKLLRATLPSTISMVTEIKSDGGYVIADPTQIHQVIMNLCTNAAHA
ncbi:MAG: PAS domain S-box protein, partial [Candidatus Latescibacterota bacterium]